MCIATGCEIRSHFLDGPFLRRRLWATQRRCIPTIDHATRKEGLVASLNTVLRHQDVTWAVAGCAVCRTFDKILATFLDFVLTRRREPGLMVQSEPVPCADTEAHVEREAEFGLLHFILYRFHFMHEVVVKRTDIFFG